MSQENNVQQQLYPSLPPAYTFQKTEEKSEKAKLVPVQQQVIYVQPVNATSPTQPLLPQQVVYYPIYHPQRVVQHAKKSRRNCCCVCWSITCCCCLFIGLIIGAAFGILAWRCSQLDETISQSYSIDASNATRFSFYAQDVTTFSLPLIEQGDYTIQERTDGINNITVVLSRKASSKDTLSQFNTSLTNQNGEVAFVDQTSIANWWNFIMMVCIEAQVSVLVPPSSSVTVYISNSNGDINVEGNFTSNFTSFTASTVNGDIYIENVNASSINAGSTNGDVTISNVVTTSLQTTSTNGDLKLDESSIGTTVKASTTNGDINFKQFTCTGTCENLSFSSTNGDVRAYLIAFSGNFDAKTTNGDVIVTGNAISYTENTDNHAVGVAGGSGIGDLVVSTTNGDITLELDS